MVASDDGAADREWRKQKNGLRGYRAEVIFTDESLEFADRVEGLQRAIDEYVRSKFYRHRRDDERHDYLNTLIIRYTVCEHEGHRPEPIKKPHHLPRCERCDYMVFQSDKLAPGYVYPEAPECGGCWRDMFTIRPVVRPRERADSPNPTSAT